VAAQYSPHDGPPRLRLTLVLGLFAAAGVMLMAGARPGETPGADWLGGPRQMLLLADLSYRCGEALDLVGGRTALPLTDLAWRLREGAVATYERQGLGAPPNPAALQRLGFIYGERGYSRQAHEALTRAATLDETLAKLLLAAAPVYDPQAPLERAGPVAPPGVLYQQEGWLADMVLAEWARRHEDKGRVARYAAVRDRRTWTFVVLLGSCGLGYGFLLVAGLVLMAIGIWRWAFTLPKRSRSAAPLMVPWDALDSLEAAGVVFLAGAVLGMLGNLAQDSPYVQEAAPTARLALDVARYLLVSALGLTVIWLRIPLAARLKGAALGLASRPALALVASGAAGYGVLMCLLAGANWLGIGGPSAPGRLLAATGGDPLLAAIRQPGVTVGLYVFLCLVVPLIEETIFRGYVYAGLRRGLGVFGATIGAALLFALMHPAGGFVPIALLGLVLAQLYERNRSLVPPMVCHALHNFLVLTLALLVQ
jgi:membrane protease YdiL (CAAX protease family)